MRLFLFGIRAGHPRLLCLLPLNYSCHLLSRAHHCRRPLHSPAYALLGRKLVIAQILNSTISPLHFYVFGPFIAEFRWATSKKAQCHDVSFGVESQVNNPWWKGALLWVSASSRCGIPLWTRRQTNRLCARGSLGALFKREPCFVSNRRRLLSNPIGLPVNPPRTERANDVASSPPVSCADGRH